MSETSAAPAASGTPCPQCGRPSEGLNHIDSDFRSRIVEQLGMKKLADSVCANCYNSFAQRLNKDEKKKTKRLAREQNRLSLWRSRVTLIREARDRFAAGDFARAAVAYEKYFRVLEIIYEVQPNAIEVSFFNNSARAKELVVIASAYWDMMRIYDQSKRFGTRLQQVADKLILFLPYTPIAGEIARRIEDYKKNAKNRDIFEKVHRAAKKGKGRCFIATASFESPVAPEVLLLSRFRDEVLLKTPWGRAFTQSYYRWSPGVAAFLDHSPRARRLSRATLCTLARVIDTVVLKNFDLK